MAPADLFGVEAAIQGAGVWGLLIVCAIVFAETGLLIGFFLPGDTLLFFTGLLTYTGAIPVPIALVVAAVALAAFAGDQLGFVIGRRAGPSIFERRDSGFFSRKNVDRTQRFFDRFGGWAVTIARFVAVVRTFAPVAAGVGKMKYSHFIGYNALGAALWSSLIIGIGYALGSIPEVAAVVERYMEWVLIGLVVVTVVSAVIAYLRQRSRARRADATHPVDTDD
ncbi:VTT domain-containing protein [Herbiconiux sp. KACC 21604]|uniref:DedA family protein n=1 Tax=unclassified Herbiconiux TaxID=2618217 RepID=UPI0014919AB9|nr:VTT domain-containing protein [Herbiconiux sp. SALV-R1]QJU54176.1 DedA family protein [Herbiconiux sp. SALV-R1]WPO85229.1 VTT domain-containing protein [Herbiconiux sp. KACC 21604]